MLTAFLDGAFRQTNKARNSQGLWLLSESKFSPLQRERYFCSKRQWCSKNLSSKSLKNSCEGVDFLLSFRLRICSFTKNEGIHRCPSRILVAYSAGSFTDSHFQVWSFVKHLLWHQNKITLEWTIPPFLDLPFEQFGGLGIGSRSFSI